MTEQESAGKKGLRHYPVPPQDFNPFAATREDMKRHGLPLRPDADTRPGVAGLWEALFETKAARYRRFSHLEPRPDTTTAAKKTPFFGALDPAESCGYMLETQDPIISLFITWTVPDLNFAANEFSNIDHFHTFVGLGFLDLHVEMTVDSGGSIGTQVWAQAVGNINLEVSTGDVMSASLCLETNSAGTAYYFIANETTSKTLNFVVDTGFPPAVTINAGVTRGDLADLGYLDPLANFGAVYFDDIRAAAETSNNVLLTSGTATTMVDNVTGATLASPVILNDNAFKVVCTN
jgi:hypothetical protein